MGSPSRASCLFAFVRSGSCELLSWRDRSPFASGNLVSMSAQDHIDVETNLSHSPLVHRLLAESSQLAALQLPPLAILQFIEDELAALVTRAQLLIMFCRAQPDSSLSSPPQPDYGECAMRWLQGGLSSEPLADRRYSFSSAVSNYRSC